MKHSASKGSDLEPRIQPWQRAGFALYVHWPFCQSKCPYCDFNSHVSARVDEGRWLSAFKAEIRRLSIETNGRVLRSIFFGGGTPSLMAPETVGGIIDEATKSWAFSNDVEITLEANPTSVEAQRFRDFRSAGVNRVSVGVQALNDSDLRKLGRLHSAEDAIHAIRTAQNTFDRSSFDLIYARQDQPIKSWENELRTALAMSADHISLYQLTVEPGTVFGARQRLGQLRGLPTDDLAADMYILTQDLCEDAGIPAYEVSNHARPNGESRHNMVYWSGGDYLGIGPGAHGRLTTNLGERFATVCPTNPTAWLTSVEEARSGEGLREELSGDDQATEMLLMGLRVKNGIDLTDFSDISEREINPGSLNDLIQSGHVEIKRNRLRATLKGQLVLNSIIRLLNPTD